MGEERPDWARVVDEWIEKLENRIDTLEEKLEKLKNMLFDVIGLMAKMMDSLSAARSLTVISLSSASLTPASLNAIRNAIKDQIKDWKDLADEFRKHLGETFWPFIQDGIGMILGAARLSNIDFDDIAASLIENFGQDAKHAVKIEDIITFYGVENANKWKRLVGTG